MQNKKSYKYYAKLFFLLIFFLIIIFENADSKKRKKRRIRSSPIVNINIKKEETISMKYFGDGTVYKNLHLGNGKSFFDVHISEINLNNDSFSVFIHKMGNHFNYLEALPKFVQNYNNTFTDSILSAINANFWKAYSNSPIGPCIVDGIVIENQRYKKWSSLLIDQNGIPYIDNFDIIGEVHSKGMKYNIDFVNRRRDSSGICFYNNYAGDTIPYVLTSKINGALDSAYKEWQKDLELMGEDSTEQEFDSTSFIDNFKQMQRGKLIEQGMYKVLLKYIDDPGINRTFRLEVVKYTSNFLELPKNHSIISFGTDIPLIFIPDIGDTMRITFRTNENKEKLFLFGISGTPRIARNGHFAHEAKQEGNNGRRFINSQLPRTFVGYNKDKTKLYLIAVEGSNSSIRQYGANLNDLSKIAKHLNLYDAMNLDGGGSSAFILDGKNLLRDYSPNSSRKLSVIIGVKKKQ